MELTKLCFFVFVKPQRMLGSWTKSHINSHTFTHNISLYSLNKPISDEIVPVNSLLSKFKITRFVNCPIPNGMDELKWLSSRLSIISSLKFDNSTGIGPVISLFSNDSMSNLERLPISLGSVLVIWLLLPKCIHSNSLFWEHDQRRFWVYVVLCWHHCHEWLTNTASSLPGRFPVTSVTFNPIIFVPFELVIV